jgi:hypothetical protein
VIDNEPTAWHVIIRLNILSSVSQPVLRKRDSEA